MKAWLLCSEGASQYRAAQEKRKDEEQHTRVNDGKYHPEQCMPLLIMTDLMSQHGYQLIRRMIIDQGVIKYDLRNSICWRQSQSGY